ncbi:unnamed protein product [Owenia fusiformis]|uniref:Uncharacterized protein n=1 Tax=Owenia fusiformis TaxID=6347 RepID=A0A8S4PSC8_OWEFU|nr:unnamed protein product [Owenia fusiformis]
MTLIPAVIIIGVGIMMFLIGLIGCVGGCKENRCILATFFSLLLIILTAMVIAGVLAYVYRDQVCSFNISILCYTSIWLLGMISVKACWFYVSRTKKSPVWGSEVDRVIVDVTFP